MSEINYAVELDTQESGVTDASLAIVAGVIRVITGRPDYDGVGPHPTGEAGIPTSTLEAKWYEGFIIKRGLSRSSRRIDVTVSGDYGTLSGFSFTLTNDQKFWKLLKDNDIHLTNRPVRMYVIIDDKFWYGWQGIVTNDPFTETDFKVVCKDDFSNIHGPLPPTAVSATNFPNAGNSAIGRALPVNVGRIPYAELIETGGEATYETLVITGLFGDTDTQIDITNPIGSTMRYTWDTVGTDPDFSGNGMAAGDTVDIDCPNFDDGNNGEFTVDAVTTSYFEITNTEGVVESNKTLGVKTAISVNRRDFIGSGATLYNTVSGLPAQISLKTDGVDFGLGDLADGNHFLVVATGGDFVLGTFGDFSTRVDITMSGSAMTLDWATDAVGTDPNFKSEGMKVGDTVVIDISSPGFNPSNNGSFPVTAVSDGSFTCTNASGANDPDTLFGNDEAVSVNKRTVEADTSKSYKIDGNNATVGGITLIQLEEPLDDVTATVFNSTTNFLFWRIILTAIHEDTWYFQVIKMVVEKQVGDKAIDSFIRDENQMPRILRWDEDKVDYERLLNVANTTDEANAKMDLISDKIERDGNLSYIYHIVPELVAPGVGTTVLSGTVGNMTDRDRTTNLKLRDTGVSATFPFTVEFPLLESSGDFDQLYLCPDLFLDTNELVSMTIEIRYRDVYGFLTFPAQSIAFYPGSSKELQDLDLNFLPNDYYRAGGNDNGEASLFRIVRTMDTVLTQVKTLFRVPDDFVQRLKERSSVRSLLMTLSFADTSGLIADLSVKQIGFVALKTVNLKDDLIHASIIGEKVGSALTFGVDNAFKHILETYDGIATADINFGNLVAARSDWVDVGRQIRDQKNSIDYLKELCRQSFVALFPTRDGKRGLRAWLEDTVPVATHDNTVIVRDSIRSFNKTPISKMFNEFFVKYSWSPGAAKYDRNLFITKVAESAFPASGPIETSAWRDFAGGFDDASYDEAKVLWEKCHEAYLRVLSKRSAPTSVSELSWFSDPTIAFGTPADGVNAAPVTFGDSTTVISIISPGGFIARLRYVSGTATQFQTKGLKIGDLITVDTTALVAGNNGTFILTMVSDGQIEYQNPGVVGELNKQLGVDDALRQPVPSAYKQLLRLIDWTTRQKDETVYRLPINATNIVRELLNYVAFNDPIFTNSDGRVGWITMIEIDPSTDTLIIKLILGVEGVVSETAIQDVPTSFESSGFPDWQDVPTSQEPTFADIQDSSS